MRESKAESVRVLAKRTQARWQVLAAGATVSVLSWSAWAFGVQQPPVSYLVAGIGVSVLVAMFLAFHDIRMDRDRLNEKLLPVFELRDNEASCYQTGENDAQGRFQTRKVMVRNISGSSIDGVKVSLVGLDPDDNGLTQIMPLALRPQHLNEAGPDYGFSLHPGEGLPVGVFGVNSRIPDFILYHVVDGVRNQIRGLEGDSYRVQIRVTARNVPPVTRVARISTDANRNPILTLLD